MIIILWNVKIGKDLVALTVSYREGGVRRGHGLWSFRLNASFYISFLSSFIISCLLLPSISLYPILRPCTKTEMGKKEESTMDKDIQWDWALCLHDGLCRDRGNDTDDARIPAIEMFKKKAKKFLTCFVLSAGEVHPLWGLFLSSLAAQFSLWPCPSCDHEQKDSVCIFDSCISICITIHIPGSCSLWLAQVHPISAKKKKTPKHHTMSRI